MRPATEKNRECDAQQPYLAHPAGSSDARSGGTSRTEPASPPHDPSRVTPEDRAGLSGTDAG